MTSLKYKMTPDEFFYKIIELYNEARKPKFYNPNIHRGRSASISSDVEDLTALFIALNNNNNCQYFTDQPIKFINSTYKYPDIVIQNEDNSIDNLIDVKTDIGWNRNGMLKFCQEWEDRIEKVKNTETTFKLGTTKEIKKGFFSNTLHYHILILSKINSGKQINYDYPIIKENLNNVSLYIMSDGTHPNSMESIQDTINHLSINYNEFNRLFLSLGLSKNNN